jgi:hypothetical protein
MVYLNKLEAELLNKASDRELSLYRFLERRTHTFIAHENDKEGTLCSLSFGKSEGLQELHKLRSSKPVKGMHYSNNMTVLIAAANIDLENERDNIGRYIEGHSYRDLFIINKALNSNFSKSTSDTVGIDFIANKLLLDEGFGEEDIASSLTEVRDLYDFYILKLATVRLTQFKEKDLMLPYYQELLEMAEKFSKRIDVFSYISLFLIFIIAAYNAIPPFVIYVIENWDKLEPIAWLVGVLVAILAALGFVLSQKVKYVFVKLKELSLEVGYRAFGLNHIKLKSLIFELRGTSNE